MSRSSRHPVYVRLIIVLLLAALALPVAVGAQQAGNLPSEVEAVLASLSQRLRENVTAETVTNLEWIAREFHDTSLGCPDPGEAYAQVITPGYQVLITYQGMEYDFRVSEGAENVILCDSRPAPPVNPTPFPPVPDPNINCDEPYTIREGDTLSEIAVACGTTVAAIMNANPQIEYRWLIYPGTTITIPNGANGGGRAVNIRPESGAPGTTIYLTASGFPAGALVQVGIGPVESEYEVVATREIGADGELAATLQIPQSAQQGQQYVGVVALNGNETISEPFTVTDVVVPPPMPTPTNEGDLFEQTQIYLVAPGDAGRSGIPIGCDDSVVPVTVNIDPTIAPLTAALNTLFAIDTRTYGQSGLYNALYRSNLQVEGISIENGEAIINLTGDITVGGTCDIPRIEAQLRQTALQYSTVDTVTIYMNGELLGDAI